MTNANSGLLCRTRPTDKKKSARIVLGLGSTHHANHLGQLLRERGWDVCSANTAEEARRASVRKSVCTVVVPYDDQDPLATAKVVTAVPAKTRVILMADSASKQARQFAEMIGVKLVSTAENLNAIADAVTGPWPIAK